MMRPEWAFDNSPIPDPTGRAARMLRFADLLRHPRSTDPDRRLQLTPWQRRIIEKIYGPSDEHGARLARTVFVLLPRGNRKTTLGSVLALAHTIGPEAITAGQVISAASERSQARIAFDESAEMIRLDPVLLRSSRIRDTKSRIEHGRTRSVYSAISADGDAQHGKTPALVLADELHVWRGFDLWNALRTGLSKTPGSLCVIITTAGEKPEGPCWELYAYARKVASGEVIDPSFLPVLWEADPSAQWDDEDEWHRVNPGLAYGFPDLASLRDEARQARQLPRMRIAFEQLHLNRWGDGSAAGWVDMAVWDEGGGPIDLAALEGRDCWLGCDLSKSYDLTAICAAFPQPEGGYIVLSFPFLPADTLRKRAETSDADWRRWAADGHLAVLPGSVIDEQAIEAKIRELCDLFAVREIAFDPKFAGRLMARLTDDGLPVVEHPQSSLHFTEGITEFQRAIIGREFHHGGHPVLRWCVGNVWPVTTDTGLVRFSKNRSADAIDCAVAAAMAIGRAAKGDSNVSVYADASARPEGFLFL
jgi:phage terminase large subunit-like protein